MKSHTSAGQINLRGKRSAVLRCGCCDVVDKREAYRRSYIARNLGVLLADDYTYEEFMADICTPEDPCELCRSTQEQPSAAS